MTPRHYYPPTATSGQTRIGAQRDQFGNIINYDKDGNMVPAGDPKSIGATPPAKTSIGSAGHDWSAFDRAFPSKPQVPGAPAPSTPPAIPATAGAVSLPPKNTLPTRARALNDAFARTTSTGDVTPKNGAPMIMLPAPNGAVNSTPQTITGSTAINASDIARSQMPGASDNAVARKVALDAQLAGQGARADAFLRQNTGIVAGQPSTFAAGRANVAGAASVQPNTPGVVTQQPGQTMTPDQMRATEARYAPPVQSSLAANDPFRPSNGLVAGPPVRGSVSGMQVAGPPVMPKDLPPQKSARNPDEEEKPAA